MNFQVLFSFCHADVDSVHLKIDTRMGLVCATHSRDTEKEASIGRRCKYARSDVHSTANVQSFCFKWDYRMLGREQRFPLYVKVG